MLRLLTLPGLLPLLLMLWLAPAEFAPQGLRFAARAAESVRNEHSRVGLIAESRVPAAGQPLTVGIHFEPKPGWHTYWQNPGDAGIPPTVRWTLPDGARVGPLRFPAPDRYLVGGIMNYVHGEPNSLTARLEVPAGLAPGAELPVRAKVDYLVCDDQLCVPESASLALDLAIGDGRADAAAAPVFAAAARAMPIPVRWPARFRLAGDRLLLAIPFAQAAAARDAYFFPLEDGALDYSAPQSLGRAHEMLRIEVQADGRAARLDRLSGVLTVDLPEGRRAFAISAAPGPVPDRADPIAGAASGAALSPAGSDRTATPASLPVSLPPAVAAFALAVLGGLLLNVMPCVFPILSLKALSLARAGSAPGAARSEALAYAAGVILSCLALGGLVLALRAAGLAVGWAFQLQDPRIILALLLLVTLIALNLAGLFELRLGVGAGQELAARGGRSGAFWTGVLAAFVATPCTGPFMGAALGAALVLPPLPGLLIFAGLGLGLALPFLAIGFLPALRRRMPRPGPWMNRLRRWLSLPMFATALALAWVLGRQSGVTGMTVGLAAALALGLVAWWLGERQRRGDDGRSWAPVTAGLAAAALGLVLLARVPAVAESAAGPPSAIGPLAAQPFSLERLAAARADGAPVFVYFTADWCISCKVNERGALSSPEVARRFAEKGVRVLVGDWTNGDPGITAFLASHGRSGVPLYLFYAPDGRIELLPQLLTVGRLTGLVEPPAA